MFGLFQMSPDPSVERRLRAIERKLDLIMASLSIEMPQEDHSDLRDLMAAGQKIQAIKLYRDQTGVGLREAKEFVESLG